MGGDIVGVIIVGPESVVRGVESVVDGDIVGVVVVETGGVV